MRLSRIILALLIAALLPACAAGTAAADGAQPAADDRLVILNANSARQSIQTYYPPLLRDARVTGEVVVAATLAADGSVSDTEVVSSTHHLFDRPSATIVQRMRFGGPVTAGRQVRVRIHFDRPGLARVRLED